MRVILKSCKKKVNIDDKMNELRIGLTPELSPLLSVVVTLSRSEQGVRHGISLAVFHCNNTSASGRKRADVRALC